MFYVYTRILHDCCLLKYGSVCSACRVCCQVGSMDYVIDKLKVVLPNLDLEMLERVRATFELHGVESWTDIGLLSSEHLVPLLKTIQCMKLLSFVRTETGIANIFTACHITLCTLNHISDFNKGIRLCGLNWTQADHTTAVAVHCRNGVEAENI